MNTTVTTTTYKMNRAGQFVKCEDRPTLSAGTIVWSFGFAGQMNRWAIIEDGGDRVVKLDENSRSDYFSDPYNTLDRYAETIENKFGIGFYYDLKAERATAEEIAAAITRANEFIERRDKEIAEEKAEEARVWDEQTAEARAKYGDYLADLSAEKYPDAAAVAKNVRKVLSHTFPGAKFSVRKQYYDCISIDWTDGPTWAEVQEAAGVFEIPSERDPYNDDLWNYKDSAFNALYGGVKYLHFSRDYSDAVWAAKKAEIEALCPDTAGQGFYGDLFEHEGGQQLWAAIKDTDAHAYGWMDSHNLAGVVLRDTSFYQAPAEKAAPARKDQEGEAPAGVSIVDYSEKAIAVIGETRPLADTLKELGGRFNARLSCGAGWIFSKRKEAEVRAALAL